MYTVLYVDDEPDLLDLAKIFLENTGNFSVGIEENAPKALSVLTNGRYDAVIADYQMPAMDGISFLVAVRQKFGDIPFILFTGRGREEVVIQAINNGADFYLQKGGDPAAQFAELAHKIHQAVTRRNAQYELRAAYEQIAASEEELRSQLDEIIEAQKEKNRTEQNLQNLVENAPDAIFIETRGIFRYLNGSAIRLFGAAMASDLLGTPAFDRVDRSFHERIRERVITLTEKHQPVEAQHEVYLRLDGTPVDVEVTAMPFTYLGEPGALVLARDITDRKRAEDALRTAYEKISVAEEELRGQYEELAVARDKLLEQKQQLEEIAGTVPGVIFQFYARPGEPWGFYYISNRATDIFGISNDLVGFLDRFIRQVDSRDRDRFVRSVQEAVGTGQLWDFEGRFEKPGGESIRLRGMAKPYRRGNELVYSGVVLDITSGTCSVP